MESDFYVFGIQWVLPRGVVDLLFRWRNCTTMFDVVIMEEKNSRTFENIEIEDSTRIIVDMHFI